MTTLINERRTAKGTISMAEIFPNSVVTHDTVANKVYSGTPAKIMERYSLARNMNVF